MELGDGGGVRVRVQPGHLATFLAEPLQLERYVLVSVDPVLHELSAYSTYV